MSLKSRLRGNILSFFKKVLIFNKIHLINYIKTLIFLYENFKFYLKQIIN